MGGSKDDTGLTHLGAREYDPTLGRFASVDPVMDLTDPQQWNAYSYTNNNPVTFSDPTGFKPQFDDLDDQHAWQATGGNKFPSNSTKTSPPRTPCGRTCPPPPGGNPKGKPCPCPPDQGITPHDLGIPCGRNGCQQSDPIWGTMCVNAGSGWGDCETQGAIDGVFVLFFVLSAALDLVLVLDPIPGDEVAAVTGEAAIYDAANRSTGGRPTNAVPGTSGKVSGRWQQSSPK